MIFLDFLWLFIFMVLIDSRPMIKSMDETNYFKNEAFKNLHQQTPHHGHENYGMKFATQSHYFNEPLHKHKLKHEEIDLTGFQNFFTDVVETSNNNSGQITSNKSISDWLEALTTELGGLKKLYGIETKSKLPSIPKVTQSLKDVSKDDSLLVSTAEIETVLNEIKQRALQMMLQQLPSASDIISNAVTETTYNIVSMVNAPQFGSDYNLFLRTSPSDESKEIYHNRRIRSIDANAATVAHKIECKLQNKVKNAYNNIKHKISWELEEELNHSKNAIKETLKNLSQSKHKAMAYKYTTPSLKTTTPKLIKHKFISTVIRVPITTKKKYRAKQTTIGVRHTIPKITDDYSMLSVYEQLLMNSHNNNVMKLLTTYNNPIKDVGVKLSKRNPESIENINLKRSIEKLYEDEEMPNAADYSDENNDTALRNDTLNEATSKNVQSPSDDDISFNTLSNKISYNDYVNGFKYYLKFQKEQGKQNFSNLVRYQAHKHHNVDDVGKYILEKLPKLPTTRRRRHLFEQETLEDQDISTKSEDSWFKKHFYLFIDKDTPKKFHTAQTVSLKEDQKIRTELPLPEPKNVLRKQQTNKNNKKKRAAKKVKSTKNSCKSKIKTHLSAKKLYDSKVNSMKTGYVDVNLVHRSTAIVKLQNKKGKKKNKFRNMFKNHYFHRKHPKQNLTGDSLSRKTRSNPFKILKDIVLRNRYTDSNNKVRKLFDYDILTSSLNPSYKYVNHFQLPNIEAMLRQIPNITSSLESPLDYDQNQYYSSNNILSTTKYFHNKGLYNTKPRPYYVSNDLSFLPVSPKTRKVLLSIDNNNHLDNTKRFYDDLINIRIKTDDLSATEMNAHNLSYVTQETNNKIDPLLESLLGHFPDEKLVKTTRLPNHYSLNGEKLQNYSSHNIENNDHENGSQMKNIFFQNEKLLKSINRLGNNHSYKLILCENNKGTDHFKRYESIRPNVNQRSNLLAESKSKKKSKDSQRYVGKESNKKCETLVKDRSNISKNGKDHKKRTKQVNSTKQSAQKAARKQVNSFKAPDHYFATPLPMSTNDFNKFLENNHIDVQSVTAPLPNYIPYSKGVTSIKKKILHDKDKHLTPEGLQVNTNLKTNTENTKDIFKYGGKIRGSRWKRKPEEITYSDIHRAAVTEKCGSKLLLCPSRMPVGLKNEQINNNNNLDRKTKLSKRAQNSILERNIQTYTAKDVAALEIVIDLRRNCQECNNENETQISTERTSSLINGMDDRQKVTNSIQIHIALPDGSDSVKRSPESVEVQRIFSAVMASPVDIQYELHTLEQSTKPSSTTLVSDKLSPGLYLLVEKRNFSCPSAQLLLKPMKADVIDFNLDQQIKDNISNSSEAIPTAVSNIFQTSYFKEDELNYSITKSKDKRSINWDSIKKFFGHDRVCNCRCKANCTMCKACAVSNAVMTELIFEFDNLAKYMKEHCTEIQTFFWMNPTGGKKLREVVNKINKSLNDYYKRVKGKCQGRTCKMFSSGIDKRRAVRPRSDIKNAYQSSLFLKKLSNLAEDLDTACSLGLFNRKLHTHGQFFLKQIHKCLPKILIKRSDIGNTTKRNINNGYSLDKININLICQPNLIKTSTSNLISTTLDFLHGNNNLNNIWNDVENTSVKGERRNGIKDFVKQRFKSKKNVKAIIKRSDLNIMSPVGKNSRHRRKVYANPIVNILYLNKQSKENKSHLKTKHVKKESKKEPQSTTKSTDDPLVKFTNNDSLIKNMDKLFKLLGNEELNNSYSIEHINKKKYTTKTMTTFTKNVSMHTNFNKFHNKTIKSKVNHMDCTSTRVKPKANEKSIETTTKCDLKHTSHKSYLINRFRNVTKKFMNILRKSTTLGNKNHTDNRHVRNVTDVDSYKATIGTTRGLTKDFNTHIISSVTVKDNPTIIILDDDVSPKVFNSHDKKEDENLRSLLLSVLNFNSKVLNNEWVRAANLKTTKSFDNFSLDSTKAFNVEAKVFSEPITRTKNTVQTKQGLMHKLAYNLSWKNNKKEAYKKSGETKTTSLYKKTKYNTAITANLISKIINTVMRSTTAAPRSTIKIGDKNLKLFCDISSTFAHVLKNRKQMAKRDFENYVKNIECYKYESVPAHFYIKTYKRRGSKKKRRACLKEVNKGTAWRRHWIRNKRTLRRDDTRVDENTFNTGYEDFISNRKPNVSKILDKRSVYKLHNERETGYFEKYFKSDQGIYVNVPMLRIKRSAEDLVMGLTNLPSLKPLTDETFVMIGDTIIIHCDLQHHLNDTREARYIWKTDHDRILKNNVFIDGSKLYIKRVEKRNSGTYFCYDHNVIVRSVKLNVIDVPNFNVVFTPVYRTSSSCTYNDLRSIQRISGMMSQLTCGNYCSVRIDEPVCLRDSDDNYLLRTVSVILPKYPAMMNCNAECQRNMRSSMAVLFAENAPVLASIPVIMTYYDGPLLEEIKTWTPSLRKHRAFVSHTLRTRDSKGHYEYQSLTANTDPNSIHVIISCPPGFFIVPTQKICGVCPSNTYSLEGDNICTACPQGTISEPGSTNCNLSLDRLTRSLWCYEPCILVKIIGLMSMAVIMCYGAFRLKRCLADYRIRKYTGTKSKFCSRKCKAKECFQKHKISPPYVGLNRLFSGTPSASHIDAEKKNQNNWKRRNKQPPLPPIDF